MKCKKCGKILTGKRTVYCSEYCSKTHLKSLYRKRNREKVNAYNRWYRKNVKRSENRGVKKKIKDDYIIREGCRKCGTTDNLTLNHIIPLSAGGTDRDENLEVLCQRCNNMEYKELVIKALKFYFKYNKR